MDLHLICNSCGEGFVITENDIRQWNMDAKISLLSSFGATIGAVSGNWGATIANQQNRKEIRNLCKCPHCGSEDLRNVTAGEFRKYTRKKNRVPIQINANATPEALMHRVELLLESKDWDTADAYCDHILDQEPDNAMAYVYKLLADNEVASIDCLVELPFWFGGFVNDENYKRAVRFADPELKEKLENCAKEAKNNFTYNNAKEALSDVDSAESFDSVIRYYDRAIELLSSITDYKDANDLLKRAETEKNNYIYNETQELIARDNKYGYSKAIENLETIRGWKDADELIERCHNSLELINASEAEKQNLSAKRNKIIKNILYIATLITIAFFGLVLRATIIGLKETNSNYGTSYNFIEFVTADTIATVLFFGSLLVPIVLFVIAHNIGKKKC